MDKVFQIKPEDQAILEHLAELVNYTKQYLTANPIYKDNLNSKQTFVIAMFAAINSYSEAIFELCKQGRAEAAMVILRSLIEAYINSNYVLSYPNNNKLWLFAIEDTYYKKSLVVQMQDFYKRYPKKQGKTLTDTKLAEMLKDSEQEFVKYEKDLGLLFASKKDFDRVWTNLLERAKKTDKRQAKSKKDGGGDFESTYLLVYKMFSEYAHLQMRGINHFWLKTPEGETLIIDRNPDNMTHVLVTCYVIYFYFAKRLKQYKIISCSFSKFDKYVEGTLLHRKS